MEQSNKGARDLGILNVDTDERTPANQFARRRNEALPLENPGPQFCRRRARSRKSPTCLSIGPISSRSPPSASRANWPRVARILNPWGVSAGQPAGACPAACVLRRPPAVHRATTPPPGPLCLGARATFALAREGACEPRRRHPQSFPQGPQEPWAPRARPGPLSERDASCWGLRLERGGPTKWCGPKPARARRAPSSLSAWAAAASAPGAPWGMRLRAAPATRTPSAQSRPAGAEPAGGHRNPEPNLRPPLLAAPSPSPGTQLVPEKPKTSSEASAAPTPRERAPSPAPSAPHPGRVNLTPRALRGKVWE
nr:translation initiation factor IF-2-like [Peromyscus maniculatus bairdii]